MDALLWYCEDATSSAALCCTESEYQPEQELAVASLSTASGPQMVSTS